MMLLSMQKSLVPWEILLRKNEKNIIFDKSFIHDAELGTVFENNRKSLTQHCERSELRLQKWTKVDLKCQKWSILASFWKNWTLQFDEKTSAKWRGQSVTVMGKLSSHKHTPKNDDYVDDASDKYTPPSQIARTFLIWGMRLGFFI